jgi:F-type H+-transporting ATPase subunit b
VNINATLIGQIITFAFFVAFCMKYVWPVLLQAMHEREQKIADGLAAADRAHHDLKMAQEKSDALLNDARLQALTVIDKATQSANQLIEVAKVSAKKEGERLIVLAQASIEQDVERAKEQLRQRMSDLVMAGASKVVVASIDSSAHNALLDQLANDL